MFYQPISLREAIENVNEIWYLPAIQRPYDWGFRHSPIQSTISLFRTESIGGRGYPKLSKQPKKFARANFCKYVSDSGWGKNFIFGFPFFIEEVLEDAGAKTEEAVFRSFRLR
jgi:hypothetical protein